VHPDIWLPNQEAYTNDLVPKGTLKLSSMIRAYFIHCIKLTALFIFSLLK